MTGTAHRALLLGLQAFSLGLLCAWTSIPANTIFLGRYGSGLLPLTYIGAALAGAVASVALTRSFSRRPLTDVAMRLLAWTAVALAAAWMALWRFEGEPVAFALLVVFPIMVPVGFMFVIGQAGMLLDVRVLKALYPRVIAGFALGFVAGGLGGPVLLRAFGGPEHLLGAASVTALALLALVTITRQRFPAELSMTDETPEGGGSRPRLRELLSNRYVALIMAFQMLSAVESQWLDFLVFDRASRRYPDSTDLAAFVSRFAAIAYGADIVCLLLLAGAVMRRFGLRYGLTANPLAVLVLTASVVVASVGGGAGATTVFVLVVATRVSDLVLSDASTRTALGAAYQAVATPSRMAAQATVEGLAVPVAIGFSGVGLLVLRGTVGTAGLYLPICVGIVLVAWVMVAALVYRGYRANLLDNLRHRVLDPAEIRVEDATTLAAVDRLIGADHVSDVRLGLEVLTVSNHPALADRLERVLTKGRDGALRADALERLVVVNPERARAQALAAVDDPDLSVRSASFVALGSIGCADDLPVLCRAWDVADANARVSVGTAMARLGSDADREAIAADVREWAVAADPATRAGAAAMLGATEVVAPLDRAVVFAALLVDPDAPVAIAALAAVHWPRDETLLPAIVGCFSRRRTAPAAVEALARFGPEVLPALGAALRQGTGGPQARTQIVRACRLIGGTQARGVLMGAIDDGDREVGLAALRSLAVLGGQRSPEEVTRCTEVLRRDVDHCARILGAVCSLQELVPIDARTGADRKSVV